MVKIDGQDPTKSSEVKNGELSALPGYNFYASALQSVNYMAEHTEDPSKLDAIFGNIMNGMARGDGEAFGVVDYGIHSISMTIIAEEALHGRQHTPDYYERLWASANTLSKWYSLFALVGSYDSDPNMSTPPKESFAKGNLKSAGFSSGQWLEFVKDVYCADQSWLNRNPGEVEIIATHELKSLYTGVARSGKTSVAEKAIGHTNQFLNELEKKHPNLEALRKRYAKELQTLISDPANCHLTEFLEIIEDDALPLINYYTVYTGTLMITAYLEALKANPTIAQQSLDQATQLIADSDIFTLLDVAFGDGPGQSTTSETPDMMDFKPMELNWEVLPPGELEREAREIVDGMQSAGESKPPTIDLERLKVLEQVRGKWGADNCYYARGNLGNRKVVRDGKNLQPDEYIILVLQERNAAGNVVAEHSVAESPIAGPHALYLFRQDVNPEVSWRQVMAASKPQARMLGARRVKHSLDTSRSALTMAEKVEVLLTCTVPEFRVIEFNGARGFRLPKGLVEIANGSVAE